MSFDYIGALDDKRVRQDLGIGEPILVSIEAVFIINETKVVASIHEVEELKVSLLFRAPNVPGHEEELTYDPFNPKHDPRFFSESWIVAFENVSFPGYQAIVDLSTLKEILKFCTRLSNLTAFW